MNKTSKRTAKATSVGIIELLSGVELISAERARQISKEEWTPKHDDTHHQFELPLAAISYVTAVVLPDEWLNGQQKQTRPPKHWPWAKKWWKPSDDPVRNLIKAGALIAAEIDRLNRRKSKAR